MRAYFYCAMTQQRVGQTTYADGVYRLEGNHLDIEAIRRQAAAQIGGLTEAGDVVLLSLTRIDA